MINSIQDLANDYNNAITVAIRDAKQPVCASGGADSARWLRELVAIGAERVRTYGEAFRLPLARAKRALSALDKRTSREVRAA